MKLLNLGCGQSYHRDWVNLDLVSTTGEVMACDLRQGIPFPDNSFDAVYHSHLLEHFPKNRVPIFLKECRRILKPSGVVRVVIPDLEQIARQYLSLLETALTGNEVAEKRYEWIMLELLDQMVRESSGGEMLRYWMQDPMPAADYVLQRVGLEVLDFLNRRSNNPQKDSEQEPSQEEPPPDPLSIGRFRLSGEVHQWMYDRYSLGQLLRAAGFGGIEVCEADGSSIPNFNSYQLDIEPDGRVRKPDSLFMEARKDTKCE
jgi:predicted SAM-dependent methyltransferase